MNRLFWFSVGVATGLALANMMVRPNESHFLKIVRNSMEEGRREEAALSPEERRKRKTRLMEYEALYGEDDNDEDYQ